MDQGEFVAFIRFLLLELDDDGLPLNDWYKRFSIYNMEQSAKKIISKYKTKRNCFGEYDQIKQICSTSCKIRCVCQEISDGTVKVCASCGRVAIIGKSRCNLCRDSRKKQRAIKKEKGKCYECGGVTFNGHVKCNSCENKQKKYSEKLKQKRIKDNRCVRCNNKKPSDKYKCCAICRRIERNRKKGIKVWN